MILFQFDLQALEHGQRIFGDLRIPAGKFQILHDLPLALDTLTALLSMPLSEVEKFIRCHSQFPFKRVTLDLGIETTRRIQSLTFWQQCVHGK